MRRSYFYHWVFSPTCPLRQRKKSVEETFQKKTPREHILARPDMYIGNVDNEEEEMWVWNSRSSCMQRRVVTWNPAFYKIFDEVLVNAADNKVRDRQQSYIDVVIDPTEGSIEVKNDGEGIPVIKHAEHGLWIPEMIFGHLLTSSNYDDSEKRVTGGRYGYGAKLTNVFSKKFVVETVHRESKQAFQMTWSNNMGECSEASLRALQNHETDYTSVKFWPDFARFKMQELDRSNTDILLRRVIDIAGVTDSTLLVRLNHQPVVVQDFNTYTDLYPGIESDQGLLSFRHQEPRWNVVIRMSDIGYQHVSFVNSIATTRGGTHVKYITDQIISFIQDQALQRRKDASLVAENVRTHLFVFVNAQIDNPSFDSQTKSTLRTPVAQFGSSCTLPKELLQNLSDSGLLERVLASMDAKALKVLNRGIGKGSQLYGIPKLDDAVFAGTEQSTRCTLILTEGDSAKALAVSGLGTIGRDYYGVFALRGKVLNVRASTLRATSNCQEIQYLMQILGLQIGQEYTSTEALRYGRVMIMADQDHDGSHIKGLVVNFLHHFWPSLVKLPGFLTQFITPIVKGHCGSKKMSFFSLIDYHKFRDEINSKSAPLENWTFKYYKGLGTSSSKEGREYFENLEKHTITFSHQNELDDRSIDLAFSPKCVDERKKWITNFEAGQKQGVDHNIKTMTFTEFVQKELIHFSVADCERSIPNVIDGMKPGQRKIMFACFKRNLRVGIKVAQLAGYVSEHTAYHHGETSLHTTIVGLAQDYVGSNNIPLLIPEGQFGTRLQGGKDHASARYIFTRLHPLTRFIYHRDDDPLLDYRDDEGLSVEPEYYVPVLPMALVNGTSGIGTGFATSIPNFNPFEIIENLRLLIANPHAELKELPPWYFGHRGAIEYRGDGRWISRGVCHQITPTHIRITELPVGVWTSAYKKFLEDMALTTIVTSFREQHTENCVHFDMTIHPLVSSQVKSPMHMLRLFRLETTIHTTNMLSYDARGRLKHYRDARDMLRDFFVIRMSLYSKRKQKLVSGLEIREAITKNKLRFLREVLSGSIRLDHKLSTLRDVLKQKGYAPDPAVYRVANSSNVGSRDGDAPQESGGSTLSEPEDLGKQRDPYDYLLSQRFLSLTEERMKDLSIEEANIQQELDFLRKQTTQEMYLNDLSLLETKIKAYYNERAREMKPPSVPIRQAKVFRPRHPELPPMAMRLIRAASRDLTHAESQRSKLAMKQVSDANIENAAEQDETLGPNAALPGGEEKKIGAALSSSNQAQPSKSKKNVKRRRRQGKQ